MKEPVEAVRNLISAARNTPPEAVEQLKNNKQTAALGEAVATVNGSAFDEIGQSNANVAVNFSELW
ncbi:hypothetical protein [Streptomyces sirii]|uniref:hypothetical protein n=1 Tax=Streptomyces sirii TaxID=3127701 RepID=UPI003D36F26C